MNAMAAFDKLLGPINPNTVASRTAADVQNAFVFEAHTEAGKSVASFLVKTGRFRVTAMFRKASDPVARGGSLRSRKWEPGDWEEGGAEEQNWPLSK